MSWFRSKRKRHPSICLACLSMEPPPVGRVISHAADCPLYVKAEK